MERSWERKFWGLTSHRVEGVGGAGLLLPAILVSPRAEDLFHVTSLPHPTSLHSNPSAWSSCFQAEGNPRDPPDKSYSLSPETIRPKGLLYLPYPALPPPIPYFIMDLGGPQAQPKH